MSLSAGAPASWTPRRTFALALAALIAGAVAMGGSTVFVRFAAAEGVGPFASAFWRVALALPFLALWAGLERRGSDADDSAGMVMTLLAGAFFAGDLVFWHLALLATTVANATFLATTAPIWVMVATVLVLRKSVSRASLVGLVGCLVGGMLLIGQSYTFAPERLRGDGYGLATAVFFAGYILAVGAARRGQRAGFVTLVSTIVTAAVLLAVALALEPRVLPASLAGWSWLVALALMSQVAGQGLLTLALGHLPAVFSALVIFIEALAAAALGWIALGEAVTLLQVAGGTAILAGIFIARPRETEVAA